MIKQFCYRAAYVLPMDRPPIKNGMVIVANGVIVGVEPLGSMASSSSKTNLIDLGEVALVPTLINAHTHLEFSHLTRPLGQSGMEFTQWIREVLKSRSAASSTLDDKQSAIQLGLAESYRAGVGCVGEIATSPIEVAPYCNEFAVQGGTVEGNHRRVGSLITRDEAEVARIHTVVFQEQLGRVEAHFSEKLRSTKTFLTGPNDSRWNIERGISPHAPYSVHPHLLDSLCKLAMNLHVPIAMHVAETMAEREFLEQQTGPFVELLTALGVWETPQMRETQSVLGVLHRLARAPRSLVIHGNYLNDAEIEFVANRRERMSVVYCPRTHDYFRHRRYPLEQMLSAGIAVAIGTDSRASNPDLNLYSELKFVAQTFPRLSPLEVLKLGTFNGAVALGVNDRLGSITPGLRAKLSQIRLPSGEGFRSGDLGGLFAAGAVCERVL